MRYGFLRFSQVDSFRVLGQTFTERSARRTFRPADQIPCAGYAGE